MDDKFNTIAGWTLFGGIVALGLSSVSSCSFDPHRPEEMGYAIQGVVEEGEGDSGPSLAMLLSEADVAAGEKVFAKCTACHTIEQGGANGIGPNLYGIMGKPIGKHMAGFAYSSALSGHGGDWTFENMDEWLKSPRAFANGTKMSFAGLSKPEDRANIIAYLNSMGSNLPLPEVEAAPEGEEGAEASDGDTAGVSEQPGGAPGPAVGTDPAAAGAMAEPGLKATNPDSSTAPVE